MRRDEASQKTERDPGILLLELIARERVGDADGMAERHEAGAVVDIGNGQPAARREAIRVFNGRLPAIGVNFKTGEPWAAIICGNLALTSTLAPDDSVTAEVARR